MNYGKWIITIASVLAVIFLYSLGKRVDKTEQKDNSSTNSIFDVENYLGEEKNKLSNEELEKIAPFESEQNSVDADKKQKSNLQLLQFWRTKQNNILSTYYALKVAEQANTDSVWAAAGDDAIHAYSETKAPIFQSYLSDKAIFAYSKASNLQPNNVDYKVKLASAYIESTTNPMQGVQMLLNEVEKDPENISVNLTLARFSIQSGQIDKAKKRLETVLSKEKNNTEALYLMSDAYKMEGNVEKAIYFAELCKNSVSDKAIQLQLQTYIETLKKH